MSHGFASDSQLLSYLKCIRGLRVGDCVELYAYDTSSLGVYPSSVPTNLTERADVILISGKHLPIPQYSSVENHSFYPGVPILLGCKKPGLYEWARLSGLTIDAIYSSFHIKKKALSEYRTFARLDIYLLIKRIFKKL